MTSDSREQLVERDQADADLGRAPGCDVRVVGDDAHAERRHPLGDQHADAAEPDDADGLLVQLDAAVLRLRFHSPARSAALRRGDVAGRGEQQADGELGGADDVGLRRVDDHHAGLRRGRDVDVVEADAGAGDDLEPAGGGQRLGVDVVALRTRRASTSATAASSAARSAPSQWRTSKSGPRASTVAGDELFGDQHDWLGHGGHANRAVEDLRRRVRHTDHKPAGSTVATRAARTARNGRAESAPDGPARSGGKAGPASARRLRVVRAALVRLPNARSSSTERTESAAGRAHGSPAPPRESAGRTYDPGVVARPGRGAGCRDLERGDAACSPGPG